MEELTTTPENRRYQELTAINGIGQSIIEDLVAFFSHDYNRQLLDQLAGSTQQGGLINITDQKFLHVTNSSLTGKRIVFTGTLTEMDRHSAKQKAERFGAKVSDSVSSQTDYVIAGENPGSKAEKAKKLGVRLVTEQEWLKLVGG
jgi:DNA ligase (NAD+)